MDFLEHTTKLQEWSNKWLLQFDEIYKVMLLGRGNIVYQYNMGNTPQSTQEAEKNLGVYITKLPVKVKSMPFAGDW